MLYLTPVQYLSNIVLALRSNRFINPRYISKNITSHLLLTPDYKTAPSSTSNVSTWERAVFLSSKKQGSRHKLEQNESLGYETETGKSVTVKRS